MNTFFGIALVVLGLAFVAIGQDAPQDDTKALIANLASSNYKVREAADRQLRERPAAEAALREAMRAFDFETLRRASEILEHLERRCVSELHAAVEAGRVDQILDQVNSWPKGKYEEEVWPALRKFAATVLQKHEKLGGEKLIGEDLRKLWAYRGGRRTLLRTEKITRATKAAFDEQFLLWAQAVDLDDLTEPDVPQNGLHGCLAIITSGSVRGNPSVFGASVILSRGDFEISRGGSLSGSLVICAGDVTLDAVFECLIIARGEVSCGVVQGSRIISGKKVDHDPAKNSIITENDPNPLGFIRWSDAPKDKEKAATKSK